MEKLSISFDTLLRAPWVIHKESLHSVAVNFMKRIEKEDGVIVENADNVSYEIINNKAVIVVDGIFYNKLMLDEYLCYVKLNLEKTLIAAVDDINVNEVILKITSPGGIVYGVAEIHDLIKTLTKIKPINVYANGLMCSALYWIASAGNKIFAYEQSNVGSIGVYTMLIDYTKMLDTLGIKISILKAGEFKTAGNPYVTPTEEELRYLQEGVDRVYDDFTKAVAEARKLDLSKKDEWANGKVFEAKQALTIGLIDDIRTWQEVLGYNKKTFSLNKWSKNFMALGEPKISELDAKKLQELNPELYAAIYETGFKAGENLGKESLETVKAELQAYKDKEQKAKDAEKIRLFATSLNLKDVGEKLIEEGKSVMEAYDILVAEASSITASKQKDFQDSAPPSAGQGSDTIADALPKNDIEAMEYCKMKYNLSKREAWKKARLEFASLFGTQTVENTSNEQDGE